MRDNGALFVPAASYKNLADAEAVLRDDLTAHLVYGVANGARIPVGRRHGRG
jgi:hypothetical protein